jgi:hypothetical protein
MNPRASIAQGASGVFIALGAIGSLAKGASKAGWHLPLIEAVVVVVVVVVVGGS